MKWFCAPLLEFKWGQNFPWLLPSLHCYGTESLCFHDTTAWCVVQGEKNFEGHLAAMITWCNIPWLLSVGKNEGLKLQRQTPHTLWTDGSHCKFHQDAHLQVCSVISNIHSNLSTRIVLHWYTEALWIYASSAVGAQVLWLTLYFLQTMVHLNRKYRSFCICQFRKQDDLN
jgi:hypothetical protein